MQDFILSMRIQKLSEATIQKRVELIHRLHEFLIDVDLLAATTEQLRSFQATYAHLAPASVHIYTRHMTAFYRWATAVKLIAVDPSAELTLPQLRKTQPHPTKFEDLKMIFACAMGRLRTAYTLATFAGLRSGEICRLRSSDINLDGQPTAHIYGKGGRERTVPLLPPVLYEVEYKKGWIVTNDEGGAMEPLYLSVESSRFLHNIGMQTTLHSMRAAFATNAVRMTHDPLLVRDLLGHESIKTTEIYMQSSMQGAHEKLADMTGLADQIMRPKAS